MTIFEFPTHPGFHARLSDDRVRWIDTEVMLTDSACNADKIEWTQNSHFADSKTSKRQIKRKKT